MTLTLDRPRLMVEFLMLAVVFLAYVVELDSVQSDALRRSARASRDSCVEVREF